MADARTEINLSSIVDAAPIGVLVVDQTGTIVYVNAVLAQMFGYAIGDMQGRPVEMLLPETSRHAHVDWRNAFLRAPEPRAMGSGRELRARHADGHLFPIEIGLGVVGDGKSSQAMAFVIDLTQRHRLEAQFAQMFGAMPFGLLLVDAGGKIVLTNARTDAMFGYAAGALNGLKLEVLIPARIRKQHVGFRDSYAMAPTIRAMGTGRDLMALHSSGAEFPVEIALAPIEQGGGKLTLAAVTDISLRKDLENNLRQANANLEEFTYVASHDLRSPLRGISDLLEWIREELDETRMTDSVRGNFDRIQVRVARTERMIDDLLTYARAGAMDGEVSKVSPREMLESLILLVNPPADARIEIEVGADVAPFDTTSVPLQTALRNLLENALKHAGRPDATIRMSVRSEGRYCAFHVEDDGHGVPETARNQIFRLFHRATTKTEGHGIGLAVTRRIVTRHGGEVDYIGESAMGGAHFRVLWPNVRMRKVDGDG
jgi:two-component system sensor kinase FixL